MPVRPTIPINVRPIPMSDKEARNFMNEVWPQPFTAFLGVTISDTPIDYMLRMSEPHPFLKKVRAFLASDYAKRLYPNDL